MKAFIKLLMLIALAALALYIGMQMQHDPGYVMVNFRGWSIETSVWLVLTLVLIAYVVVYFLMWLVGACTRLPGRLCQWQQQSSQRKASQLTQLGLCDLAEGRWQKAEKKLLRGAFDPQTAFINYLSAARAAQAQKAYVRRDQYLEQAHQSVRGSALAVGLTQAQLELGSQQWQAARLTLEQLHREKPKQTYVIELLVRLYLQLKDWENLQKILPDIKRYKVLAAEKLISLEQKLYLAKLQQAAVQADLPALTSTWKQLPRNWRQTPELQRSYIDALLERQQDLAAAQEIVDYMARNWDQQLVLIYAQLNLPQPKKQLQQAERWLQKHPPHYASYLACAILSKQLGLWGQANDYLDKSMQLQPSALSYQLLGELSQQQNMLQQASEYYRQGLQLANKQQLKRDQSMDMAKDL